MSAESSPAAAPAPAPAPKAKPKAKTPTGDGGLPPAFKTTKPPVGRPTALEAAVREAEARDQSTTTEEV